MTPTDFWAEIRFDGRTARVRVAAGTIVYADAALKYAVGKKWIAFREFARSEGMKGRRIDDPSADVARLMDAVRSAPADPLKRSGAIKRFFAETADEKQRREWALLLADYPMVSEFISELERLEPIAASPYPEVVDLDWAALVERFGLRGLPQRIRFKTKLAAIRIIERISRRHHDHGLFHAPWDLPNGMEFSRYTLAELLAAP